MHGMQIKIKIKSRETFLSISKLYIFPEDVCHSFAHTRLHTHTQSLNIWRRTGVIPRSCYIDAHTCVIYCICTSIWMFPLSEPKADLKEAQTQTHTHTQGHTSHIHHQSLSVDRLIYSTGQNLKLYLYLPLGCILPIVSLSLVFPVFILSIYSHMKSLILLQAIPYYPCDSLCMRVCVRVCMCVLRSFTILK